MRTSLTGLDGPTANRLQLAILLQVLQFIWASTQHDLQSAFFGTLASLAIFASLLPAAAVVVWLIRRVRYFMGKSAAPKSCSRTTICNWIVALSAMSSMILHVPYIGLGFIWIYFVALAAVIAFAALSVLDLLNQIGDRLRQRKNS